jgi:tRNA A37 N6-isopentenylltransferase MiaA
VGVLPFAKYAEATRALRRGTGVAEALERMQVSLPQYLKAHVHWMHVMTDDAALAAHLACALASS